MEDNKYNSKVKKLKRTKVVKPDYVNETSEEKKAKWSNKKQNACKMNDPRKKNHDNHHPAWLVLYEFLMRLE